MSEDKSESRPHEVLWGSEDTITPTPPLTVAALKKLLAGQADDSEVIIGYEGIVRSTSSVQVVHKKPWWSDTPGPFLALVNDYIN